MKTNSRKPNRRMVVTEIFVCHLPYQPHTFVVGTIRDTKSETGKTNVWLRNDGQWTQDEASPKCYLRIGSWNPPAATLIVAFVQGAQWWEYHKTRATMWGSDREQAECEAEKRTSNGTLGKSPNGEA